MTDELNVYVSKNGNRHCRACARDRAAIRRAKNKPFYEANKEKINAERRARYAAWASSPEGKAELKRQKDERAKQRLEALYRKDLSMHKWYQKNQQTIFRRRMQKYGITPERYDEMFSEQNGKCKICGRGDLSLVRSLAVDHCHRTGRVRGLLCGKCNQGLGQFSDDSEAMRRAASYVEREGQIENRRRHVRAKKSTRRVRLKLAVRS